MFYFNTLAIAGIQNQDIYLPELLTFSFQAGAVLPISFAHFVFLHALVSFNEFSTINLRIKRVKEIIFYEKRRVDYKKILTIVLVFISAVSVVLLLRVIGNPAFLWGDRFLYQEKFVSGLWSKLTLYSLFISPLSFVAFMHYKEKRFLIPFCINGFYNVWIGNKFTEFFFLLTIGMMIVPLLYKKILTPKVISVLIFSILSVFALLFFSVSILGHKDTSETMKYFSMRTAQQGQLWWRTYSIYNDISPQPIGFFNEFKKDVNPELTNQTKFNQGIASIMAKTTSVDIVENKLYKGKSVYTMSTDSTLYYYFGYIGLLFSKIILAIMTILIVYLLICGIQSLDIILLFLGVYFYKQAMVIDFMSSFTVFRKSNLLMIFILGIWLFIRYGKIKKIMEVKMDA